MSEQPAAKSLQQRKEKLILAYANPQKLVDMLLALGFFSKTGSRLMCPNWRERYYEKRVTCEARREQGWGCVWSWDRVGENPDCPLDRELKAALDSARKVGVRGILEKTVKFTLQEIYGKHAVDIAVSIPEAASGANTLPISGTVPANEFFALSHDSPARYFIIFDLELASALKAIRYIHLLLEYASLSKARPILVTLNRDEAVKATIEGQGIRVHVAECETDASHDPCRP